MSFAAPRVSTSPRRRAIANALFEAAWGPLSIDELQFLQTVRVVDLVDQAIDHSLAGIRSRGPDPQEDVDADSHLTPRMRRRRAAQRTIERRRLEMCPWLDDIPY